MWYIGDNYECDVVGAREAGLFPVWYTGAAQEPVREDSGPRPAFSSARWKIRLLGLRNMYSLLAMINSNVLKGTEAVLRHAARNRHGFTAAQVQAAADEINAELGRFDPARRHLFQVEAPNHMFTAYLYESMGIAIPICRAPFPASFSFKAIFDSSGFS